MQLQRVPSSRIHKLSIYTYEQTESRLTRKAKQFADYILQISCAVICTNVYNRKVRPPRFVLSKTFRGEGVCGTGRIITPTRTRETFTITIIIFDNMTIKKRPVWLHKTRFTLFALRVSFADSQRVKYISVYWGYTG